MGKGNIKREVDVQPDEDTGRKRKASAPPEDSAPPPSAYKRK